MTTTRKLDPWRFQAGKFEPEEAKKVYPELLDDPEEPLTMLDLEDEYEATVSLVINRPDTEKPDIITCDEPLKINFKDQTITLPTLVADTHALEPTLRAVDVRYADYAWYSTAGGNSKNDGKIIVLSIWIKDHEIQNIYFQNDSLKDMLIILNALTRFVYETSGKSAIRTRQFVPLLMGRIEAGYCSAEEAKKRDEILEKEAGLSSDSDDDEAGPKKEKVEEKLAPLETARMHFVLDEEAMCLFPFAFSPKPVYDFRFFREELPKSIDSIFVCTTTDQLEVHQSTNVYYLQPITPSETAYVPFKELIDILRSGKVKPKPKNTFSGTGRDFDSFFSVGFIGTPYKMPKGPAQPAAQSEPTETPAFSFEPPPFRQPMEFAAAPPPQIPWIDNINTGDHLQKVDADLQMTWFAIEPELEKLITEGTVPVFSIESAGLDPKSSEHLQKLIDEIKDKLLAQEYGVALSRLRATLKVYGRTLLRGAVSVKETELMKRVYFLSG